MISERPQSQGAVRPTLATDGWRNLIYDMNRLGQWHPNPRAVLIATGQLLAEHLENLGLPTLRCARYEDTIRAPESSGCPGEAQSSVALGRRLPGWDLGG